MAEAIRQVDCLIVGAGMVGSALACLLGRDPVAKNLSVVLIEPKPFRPSYTEASYDPRVVALTEQSRGLLERAGVWSAIAGRRCCPYRDMIVQDGDGTGRIAFHAGDVQQDNLGHIVENSVIVEQLLASIQAQGAVELLCPAKLEQINAGVPGQQGCQVTLDNGLRIQAGLVVAADGAMSKVRELAGFKTREWSYGQHAIVATIETEKPHQFTARQWFRGAGPLAFLPLQGASVSEGHQCSIVWSQDCPEAERLMTLNDEDFCRELSFASEGVLGKVIKTDRRYRFPLQQRHAVDYIKPGLALVGDAAHSIHPLAGQGANLGFQDIEVLLAEILRALQDGLSPGHDLVLQRYQRKRKAENLRMMLLMEGFKRLFESDTTPVRLLRNEGMSQLNRLLPVKKTIIREVMGLK